MDPLNTIISEINNITTISSDSRIPNNVVNQKVQDLLSNIESFNEKEEIGDRLNNLIIHLKTRGLHYLADQVTDVAKNVMFNSTCSLLEEWAKHGNPDESRNLAVDMIVNYLNGEIDSEDEDREFGESLNLEGYNLIELPPIFHIPEIRQLKSLNLKGNQLKTLPSEIGQLQDLIKLNLENNKLTELPHEIGQLKKLEYFHLNSNQLWILPSEFSQLQSLWKLELRYNRFFFFPAELCNLKELGILRIGLNPFQNLPEDIGKLVNLIELNVSGSFLERLPASFSKLDGLEILKLFYTSLTDIPREIGNFQHLRQLGVHHNRFITGFPLEILNLPQSCEIELEGCNLSRHVIDNLRTIMNDPEYNGPRISYSMPRETSEELSINQSLEKLYKIIDKPYERLENIPGNILPRATLEPWLSRLFWMSEFKDPKLKKGLATQIIKYLELANKNKEFCEMFNMIIQDASETCGDRVALSVMHLGIAYKLCTFDMRNMKELAQFLKRGVWALNLLENIARNKVPTLPFFDEIEVYLGYPIMLKKRLQLPIDIEEMLFFQCSALTSEDLDDAAKFVEGKLENEDEYYNFLIQHDTWQKALQANYKDDYLAIINKRDQSAENANSTEEYKEIQTTFNNELLALTKRALKKRDYEIDADERPQKRRKIDSSEDLEPMKEE